MKKLGALLRSRFLRFRREILVVLFALRHPDTPWRLRLAGAFFLLYLASPVDLVPIFIPVLGVVDDLVLVPWGLSQVVRRLPPSALQASQARADGFIHRWVRRPLVFLALLLGILALLWGLLLLLFWRVLTTP
jgi:uncharacterized membrane protein YkvA (DUF1232 family)